MDVHAAALVGDVEKVRQYVDDGGDPNQLNEAGITPLHSAAVKGQVETIRVLVAAGADTDLKVSRNKRGENHDASPLLLAVLGSFHDAAQALLQAGAEVGAKNSKGLTPLHVSCLKPNASMVRLLLLWGADTNARDRKKRTPEQLVGRLGNDSAEEDTVRVTLRKATAARNMALIANSAHASSDRDGGSPNADACRPSRPSIQSYGSLGTTVAAACPDLTNDSPSSFPPAIATNTRGPHDGGHTEPLGASYAPLVALRPPSGDSDTNAREAPNGKALPLPPPPPAVTLLPASSCEIIGPQGSAPTALLYEKQRNILFETAFQAPSMAFGKTGTTVSSSQSRARRSPPMGSGNEPVITTDRSTAGSTDTFSFGALVDGEYKLEKALACSSGSGELWFACKPYTGEEVVIKRVLKRKGAAFEREWIVLKFLQRQGLKAGKQHSIPFVGVIPRLRCLVLGRGSKNLRQIGNKIYQKCAGNAARYMDRVRPYARQVVEICQWLHGLGVVWGDVKPENFVEGQNGDLKAIDFDSACAVAGGLAASDSEVSEVVGSRFDAEYVLTPRYCAPEKAGAFASGHSCIATKASEVWSVGMVLFWLLTGQDYFEEGLTDAEVMASLCRVGFVVSLAAIDSRQEQAKHLLATMLCREPEGRGSMDSALARAFFAGGASISMTKLQAEMSASITDASQRLEVTIREEGGCTRLLLSESLKRLESHADDILENLGRIDRMLDSVVEGASDCPRLFVLTPLKGAQSAWKPSTWFSDYNKLTFLCAHDLAPVGEGIKVPCPRSALEKWAPAIQSSAFMLKLGCKAACMTAGISPAIVDGMSEALGTNLLTGKQACADGLRHKPSVPGRHVRRKVSAALQAAAGRTLGKSDKGREEREAVNDESARCTWGEEEAEGRKLTGEAYEALVVFLDETDPCWRANLKRDMIKAARRDGKVSWTCHEHAEAWSRAGVLPQAGGEVSKEAVATFSTLKGTIFSDVDSVIVPSPPSKQRGQWSPKAPSDPSQAPYQDDPPVASVPNDIGDGGKRGLRKMFAKVKRYFRRQPTNGRVSLTTSKTTENYVG